ncbi:MULTISPECIES: hypothetical protein [unclassified Mesorhizobium]|uniref:hypothetical protein n=1 Tax=unclassified Mesorhizobium TaxID=325217 RepID=UPI003336A584
MIATFLLNCIPACSVAEIPAEGLAVDENREIGRIKGREVRLGSADCFPYNFRLISQCAGTISDVRYSQFFSVSMETAPRGRLA